MPKIEQNNSVSTEDIHADFDHIDHENHGGLGGIGRDDRIITGKDIDGVEATNLPSRNEMSEDILKTLSQQKNRHESYGSKDELSRNDLSNITSKDIDQNKDREISQGEWENYEERVESGELKPNHVGSE